MSATPYSFGHGMTCRSWLITSVSSGFGRELTAWLLDPYHRVVRRFGVPVHVRRYAGIVDHLVEDGPALGRWPEFIVAGQACHEKCGSFHECDQNRPVHAEVQSVSSNYDDYALATHAPVATDCCLAGADARTGRHPEHLFDRSPHRGCSAPRSAHGGDTPARPQPVEPLSIQLQTSASPVAVRLVTCWIELTAARRLHAQVYLDRRYVEPEDVIDGMLTRGVDPWVAHSTYFVAYDPTGALVGVSRQIRAPRTSDLPALNLRGLDRGVTAQLLRQTGGSVVEISGLAVAKGAPTGTATALYSSMWHHGIVSRHAAWVMSVHPEVFRLLIRGLGPLLEPFGPEQWFMGSDVVPAVAWTDTLSPTVARHASTLTDPHQARVLPALFPPTEVRRTA